VFSAVVSIHNGTVYNITWDNYCGLCEDTDKYSTLTLNTETGRRTQICNSVEKCKEKSNSDLCDPKIYISSAGMRLGRFRNFNMEHAYKAAENLTNVSESTSTSTTIPTIITS